MIARDGAAGVASRRARGTGCAYTSAPVVLFGSPLAVGVLALVVAACGAGRHGTERGQNSAAGLRAADIAALIEPRVPERAAWGGAVHDALRAVRFVPDPAAACAVIAVIAQESGFKADPAVPGLAAVIERRIDGYERKLGPLGQPLLRRLLDGRAPGHRLTFAQRLKTVRTERDVDVIFRDMLVHHRKQHGVVFDAATLAGKLFDVDSLTELNPITTAGPMQVSVRFAEAWAREHGRDPATVRDALYTPAGGVLYGTARLFAHRAAYAEPIFRFADYNAGLYASRNAAVQAQVARLAGVKLALDGDLLAYGKDGEVADDDTNTMRALQAFRARWAPSLSERRVRDDAHREKTQAFERTDTYAAIKRAFAARFGSAPRYAILPEVEIESPKLSRKRSTAWFARSVQRRYDACRARARALGFASVAVGGVTP